MQPITFAARLLSAALDVEVYATLPIARSLARRAGRDRRFGPRRRPRCSAPTAGMGPEALPRQLRWPWSGGFVALARAAGVARIEPGRAPQISRTCVAPMVAPATCIFTAAIAA